MQVCWTCIAECTGCRTAEPWASCCNSLTDQDQDGLEKSWPSALQGPCKAVQGMQARGGQPAAEGAHLARKLKPRLGAQRLGLPHRRAGLRGRTTCQV